MVSNVAKRPRSAHAVADAAVPTVRRAWQFALARAVQRTEFPRLYNAIEIRNVTATVGAVEWGQMERHLEETLVPDLLHVMARSGKEGWPVEKRIVAGFQTASQRMALAARRQSYELIQGVTEESRQAIRTLVTRLFERNLTVDQIAKEIRSHIGLNRRDSLALSNYADGLHARVLTNEISVDQALKLSTDYRNRLLAQRADTIARTETMRASNAGQHEAWQQAREMGLIPQTQQRQWLITDDERLCQICASVPAKGPVGLDQPFILGDGTPILAPPAHPLCRCTMSLA